MPCDKKIKGPLDIIESQLNMNACKGGPGSGRKEHSSGPSQNLAHAYQELEREQKRIQKVLKE